MKEDAIQHIVNLYLMFQRGIPNASRAHFSDLNRLLSPVIGPQHVEVAVEKFFSEQGRKILRSEMFLPLASSVRLLGTSRLLGKMLAVSEKTYCLGMLLKLLADNNQRENKEMLANIAVVGDIFGFSKKAIAALACLYFERFPVPDLYGNSVILTKKSPDFNLAVEGIRYLWMPEVKVHVWFLKLPDSPVVLCKVLENNLDVDVFSYKENDVLLLNEQMKIFLSHSRADVDSVLAALEEQGASMLPRVEIPPSELTPHVILDPVQKKIVLSGHSLAVGTQKFYDPVFLWIKKLAALSPPEMSVHFRLNYFNTYTSKVLLEIFLEIRQIEQRGTRVNYNWYYLQDDDELRETGEHYEDILKVNFRFIELQESELNVLIHE